MPKPIKVFFKIIIALIIIALILVGAVLAYFTYAEYRPRDEENLNIRGAVTSISDDSTPRVEKGKTLTLMSWNVGYGGLGETADYSMEDGTMARLPEVAAFARAHGLPLATVDDVAKYRLEQEGRRSS